MKTTIAPDELSHFQKDSQNWQDPEGPFAPLHAINPLRIRFILDTLGAVGPLPKARGPLAGKTLLDVGCGGGLLTAAAARLKANVTGIDADAQAIKAAQTHAKKQNLSITYAAQPIEIFRKKKAMAIFDIVTAMEIIEHVADIDLFLDELAACVRPGGFLFMSTLNRTIKSYLLGIIAAEHILGLVPTGTHTWRQFVKPSELTRALRARGFMPLALSGITYNPLRGDFALSPKAPHVNYIMGFQRNQ